MADKHSSQAKLASVPCPGCSAKSRIPLDKITDKGLIYNCPKCQTAITIQRTKTKIIVRKAKKEEIQRRGEGEEEVKKEAPEIEIVQGAPNWVVTFADLATLLLTFFVLMLSFANMDIIRFKELVGSVQDRYGVTKFERGSYQAVSKGKMMDVDSNLKETAEAVAREKLVNVVYDIIVREGFRQSASVTSTDEGVRVRVKGRALFEPGSAKLDKQGLKLLDGIVMISKNMKNLMLTVEGHTDDSPIHTAKFPSNWELSVMRASSVLEYMIGKGAPPERLSAAGFADTRPLFSNEREETRVLNRRVEFLFKRI